jgi:hypothetical protein
MIRPIDPLELLRRRDKHLLSAGDGVLFDPPHPLWLDRPGFWDGGHVLRYGITPLFTVSLVELSGKERPLRRMHRDWTPAEMVSSYVGGGLELEERRLVLPGGRFVSEWRVTNGVADPADLSIVAWTAQDASVITAREAAQGSGDGIVFARTAHPDGEEGVEIALLCTLRFEHELAEGWSIYEVDPAPGLLPPEWMLTPFRERWRGPALANERQLAPSASEAPKTVFAGLSRRLRLGPGEADSFTITLHVAPAAPELRPVQAAPPAIGRGAAVSRTAWQQHFAAAPTLSSSDPFLERAFAYRWFGLRVAGANPVGHFAAPCIAEGTGGLFRASAGATAAIVRDLRWLADPERARGSLRAFFARQDEGGRLPSRIGADHSSGYGLAVADWGGALRAIDEVHPDRAFLEEACAALTRAADAFDQDRDPEGSGLLDGRARGEGRQNGIDRFDGPAADSASTGARLKGVDVSVWQYRLRRTLEDASVRLDRPEHASRHRAAADRIRDAVRAHLWDPSRHCFSEAPADTLRAAGTRSAAGFLPFLCDLADASHLRAITQHLLDPRGFWTPAPLPIAPDSTGARARWSSPGANAFVAEALARVATELEDELRIRAAELLQRVIRLQFFEGDPARPNAFDAYRTDTGWPAARRGHDDCLRGHLNDLIIRYVAGLRPSGAGLIVDPLPCGVERLRLDRVPYRGRRLGVTLAGLEVTVTVDGVAKAQGEIGTPITLEL